VISEVIRPSANEGVVRWLRERAARELYISVLLWGEVRKGVLLLPQEKKRERLEVWLRTDLIRRFHGRILPVDDAVALTWGGFAAEGRESGRELPVVDGLLLATAAVHGLTLVTRNDRDCSGRGVETLNPWS
jgi:predicted nucleic acid-binding protein